MPVLAITDYVLTGAGKSGQYVQFRDNRDPTITFSTITPTDANGRFDFSATPPPPADYSVYTRGDVDAAWVLYDPHFRVAYTRGDDAVLSSLTVKAVPSDPLSPYAPSLSILPGEIVSAVNPYNLKAYGTKGDGVTDDTPAMTAWANALNAAVNAEAVVPPGTYPITPGTVPSFTGSPKITCAGKDGVVIKARAAAGNYLLQTSGASGFELSGATLDGTGLTGTIAAMLNLLTTTDVRIRNCRLQNIPITAVSNVITLNSVQRAWIENNDFINNPRSSGVFLQEPAGATFNDQIWITNNYLNGTGGGVADGAAAIQCEGTVTTTKNRYVRVIGNHIVGAGRVGISCNNNDWLWIERNYVDNTGATGEAIAYTGSHVKVHFNYAKSGSGAAAILKWAVIGRSNDHDDIAHNECTGSTGQQIGIAWGTTGASPAVINDLYIHDNECYNGGVGVGIQSFLGPGVTVATWTNVVVTNNKLVGSAASVTWVGAAGNPALVTNNIETSTGYSTVTNNGAPATFGQLLAGGAGLGIGALISGVESSTSYIVAQLKAGTSGYGSYLHLTDGVTYNAAFGTETNGDFGWYSGRFPGTAGTKRLILTQAGDLIVPNAGRILTQQTVAPTVGSGGAGVSALSVIAGSTNIELQVQVTLTAVAPGVVVGVVTFNGSPLASAPKAVVCSLSAPTAGVASPPIVGADTYATTGFTIRVYGPTTVTTGTYIITCHVFF